MTSAFPETVLMAVDADSGLEGTLTLVREADEGVSEIVVTLRNRSDHDVSVAVNAELSAFLIVAATDDRGRELSTASRKFATDEQQSFESVSLHPGAQHSWRAPLANWIPADRIPREGLFGRLVVNVVLVFTSKRGDGQSLLTLYDTNVRFTRRALGLAD